MKKKLYLHIGMGKTGTTALQNFFWENRKVLAKRDVCYPKRGTMANAHHLLSPHIPRFLENEWNFQAVDEWAPELAKSAQNRVLLSSELMAWAEESKARKFCAQVSAWFDVYVVIYLRRQDDIIMASYNQQIKAGPQKRRVDLIYRKQVERFDYPKILAPWADSLEPGEVIVRPYEKQQFHGGDIRHDFLRHAFQIDVDDSFAISNKDSNPRLPLNVSEYKRMVNCLVEDGRKNDDFNQLLMEFAAEQDVSSTRELSTQSVLSPEQRIEIIELCRPDNAFVASHYLERQNGCLFEGAEPSLDDSWDGIDLSSEDASHITDFLKGREPRLMRHLAQQIESFKDALAYQKRHSARFLSRSVLGETAASPVYRVAKEDSSPLVIGGVGGSGTRLVVNLLSKMGVVMGGELNESLDNLWFSLLFVRRSILLQSDSEQDKLSWLFANAMRHGVEVTSELTDLLDQALACDRSPVIPEEQLLQARESLLSAPPRDRRDQHWGWKEPNSHILLPMLDRCFPEMKFVFVMRNGLDMAFSDNRNQLEHFWGDLMLEGDSSPTPQNLLRYWIAAHKRMQGFRQRLGHRLHFLSFDRLCLDPEGELEALREFAGIQISKKDMALLADSVSPPKTMVRFREHDLSVFDPADIDFVKMLGFDVT